MLSRSVPFRWRFAAKSPPPARRFLIRSLDRKAAETASMDAQDLLLQHVLKVAEPTPTSVLSTIDTFCWEQQWMMHVGDVKGAILEGAMDLVQPPPCRYVLELGVFCGYSTTRIAAKLPEGGRLYSIEPNKKSIGVAQQILTKAGVSEKVILLEGKAAEVLPTLQGQGLTFDLVFIDHDKSHYLRDLQLIESLGLMREDTVVVADNVVVFQLTDYQKHVRESGKYKKSWLVDAAVEYKKREEAPDGVEISIYRGNGS